MENPKYLFEMTPKVPSWTTRGDGTPGFQAGEAPRRKEDREDPRSNLFTPRLLSRGIHLNHLLGLEPKAWLCVGEGFSREDVKSVLLGTGQGIVGQAVMGLDELCLTLTGIPSSQVLGSFARQEVLNRLLAESRLIRPLDEIKRLKRRRDFVQKLDRTFQQTRLSFAHPEEELVYQERLNQHFGKNPRRDQIRALAHAYEAWLEASSFWDRPRLIRKAIENLIDQGWPESVSRPEEIWVLALQAPQSLEKYFWETLGQSIPIRKLSSPDFWLMKNPNLKNETSLVSAPPDIEWQLWHTLDDAAESLADFLKQAIIEDSEEVFQRHAILIPDVPAVRRCLRRAFEARGLVCEDPRDPTQIQWDESYKWALLPLEVVASQFERQKVIAWLRAYRFSDQNFTAWVTEINSRGLTHGLSAYQGGGLAGLGEALQELQAAFGGKKTCKDLADRFMARLKKSIESSSDQWKVAEVFQKIWDDLCEDLERVGEEKRQAPALYWLERLQLRFRESPPPVERLKPKIGVRVYRLQQAPVHGSLEVLWILGLPPYWLSSGGNGNFWYSERDQEILAAEFDVRSRLQVRAERLEILKDWIQSATQLKVLDAIYQFDGRERESIFPILKELESEFGFPFPASPQERGAYFRFSKSYHPSPTQTSLQPIQIKLPPLSEIIGQEQVEITATALDRYSKCSFLALVYHRWKLEECREPDFELWPDVKGNIIHEAVRILVNRLSNGQVDLSEVLNTAWRKAYPRGPKGLVRGPGFGSRIDRYVKTRLLRLLEVFYEKEKEYLERSQVKPGNVDQDSFQLVFDQVKISGRPDRIDFHEDGVFIMDYKTSGAVPHGEEMIEQGYRLQLPFYSMAVRQTGQKVLGLQFVEFDRTGSRKSGIFFKDYNGKEEGKLTRLRSNSKSLIPLDPDQVWRALDQLIEKTARDYVEGNFSASPNRDSSIQKEKECSTCRVGDLCGFRRRLSDSEAETN